MNGSQWDVGIRGWLEDGALALRLSSEIGVIGFHQERVPLKATVREQRIDLELQHYPTFMDKVGRKGPLRPNRLIGRDRTPIPGVVRLTFTNAFAPR